MRSIALIARITKFKMREGSRDDATEILNSMKQRILELQGIRQFISSMNADGSGYVVVLVDSAEDADANEAEAQEIWSNFGKFLEGPPLPENFDLIANWKP